MPSMVRTRAPATERAVMGRGRATGRIEPRSIWFDHRRRQELRSRPSQFVDAVFASLVSFHPQLVPPSMRILLLAVPVVFAATGPVEASNLDREFRFAASTITTRWRGDSVAVEMRNGIPESVPGRADLPAAAERVDIPAGMRVRAVTVLESRVEPIAARARIATVMPVAPRLDGLGRPLAHPATSAPRPALLGTPLVEVGYQGSMRGQAQAWLLVHPVQWDRATGRLERIASLRTRIELEPDPDVVRRERVVPEWEGGASSGITPTAVIESPKRGVQPFKPTQLPSVLGSPVAYVIVTTDLLASEFQ